jgi:hypothetical protein
MLPKEMFLRTAEDRAAHKRRLRFMLACYGLVALAGVATFALKPAATSASVTIQYPAAEVPAVEVPTLNLSSPY